MKVLQFGHFSRGFEMLLPQCTHVTAAGFGRKSDLVVMVFLLLWVVPRRCCTWVLPSRHVLWFVVA